MSTRWQRPARAAPSSRIPLPASRISSQPSPVLTLTHEVLPPYLAASEPATGIEPRTPQSFTSTGSALPAGRHRPEHDEGAVVAGRADQGERPGDDLHRPALGADEELPVAGAPLAQGRGQREVVDRYRPPLGVHRSELGVPLVPRDHAPLLEPGA